MKQLFLVTLTLASLTASPVAQSPPPPPAPTIEGENKQDLSASEQHNSKYSPTPTVGTTKHNVSAEDMGNKEEQRSTNEQIDFLAWVVAFAAVAQFIAAMIQAWIMKRGLKATEIAANAANTSAEVSTEALGHSRETLRVTERAIIRMENVSVHTTDGSRPCVDKATSVNFKFRNFGRTEARAVKITGKLLLGDKEDSLANPTESIIPPQGQRVPFSRSLSHWLDDAEIAAITKKEAKLWYEIKATYIDVFNVGYSYTATGVWNQGSRSFNIRTNSETVI